MGVENLAPTGIRSSDRPVRGESLCRPNVKMYTHVIVTYNHLCILFNIINFTGFVTFVTIPYKKRLPEVDVNTSQHVGVLYDRDIVVNILCICCLNYK